MKLSLILHENLHLHCFFFRAIHIMSGDIYTTQLKRHSKGKDSGRLGITPTVLS